MDTIVRTIAVIIGVLGVIVYFRSIVRTMLLNWPESDVIERTVRRVAVNVVHALAGNREYREVQRIQAWILPIFIFLIVASWFLLVQFSFSLIIWGPGIEAGWPRAFSSSGSALSTLGYLTPSSLVGEYLAVYEAAIGLAIVILIFTFVPGYQAAIQIRERKVGWVFARTGMHPNCVSMLEALAKAGPVNERATWEDLEAWFRGIYETHLTAPIIAYVPSVYRNTSWLGTSAAVLDTASLILSTLDVKDTDAVRLCREAGVTTLRSIAEDVGEDRWTASSPFTSNNDRLIAGFDALCDKLAGLGLPLKSDRKECCDRLVALRSDYEATVHRIKASTLMPVEVPWAVAHASTAAQRHTST
ncbi:MAG TPA: hypothetical protein VIZ90_10155 [Rhizobiaceae bacterium]